MDSLRALLMRWWFLFVLLGVLQALVMPPFQVPDEPAHWMAGISRIHHFLRGEQPLCSTEVTYFKHYGLRPGIHHEAPAPGTLQPECGASDIDYGGVLSYPQLWGSHVLHRFWSTHPEISFRVARLLSGFLLVFVLGLTWHSALRKGHVAGVLGSLWAGLLLMSPVGVQQAFGVSSDGVVMGFALLLASLLHSSSHWRSWDWGAFLVLGVCAVSTKPVVAPLLLAGFLVRGALPRPWQKGCVAGLFLVGVLSGLLSRAAMTSSPHGDVVAQKAWILAHPFKMMGMLFYEAFSRALPYTQWLVGRLGWLDHTTSHLGLAIYFAAFITLAWLVWKLFKGATSALAQKPDVTRGLLFLGIWIGSACLIELYVFLTWNPPGYERITGLQGRYMIPLHMVAAGYVFAALKEWRPVWLQDAKGVFRGVSTVFWIHATAMAGIAIDLLRFYRWS